MDLLTLIRKPVKKITAIQWGKTNYDNSYIILKWGENPYSPSKNIITAINKSIYTTNRYPNLMTILKDRLKKYTGCNDTQICLTNGSDKAFRLIAEVFIDKNNEAITFTPSYPVFDKSTNMMGGKVIKVPLDKNFKIPTIKLLNKYVSKNTKIIYVCNPNNPTGNFIATNQEIEQLLKLNLIIVVDEAYFEFSGKTAISLLKKNENLIILRSFSKTFGLAGLRVAYTLSSPKIIDYLNRIEDSLEVFNTSTPSLAGAIASIENYQVIKKNIEKINNTKRLLVEKLNEINILTYSSFTSFIMFNLKKIGIKTKDFIKGIEQEKIILKDVSIYSGLSEYDVYMAIPRDDQLEKVVNSINKVIKNSS